MLLRLRPLRLHQLQAPEQGLLLLGALTAARQVLMLLQLQTGPFWKGLQPGGSSSSRQMVCQTLQCLSYLPLYLPNLLPRLL
jgi:hypothetical protein